MFIKGASMTASPPLVPCKIEYFWPKQQAGQIIHKKKTNKNLKQRAQANVLDMCAKIF